MRLRGRGVRALLGLALLAGCSSERVQQAQRIAGVPGAATPVRVHSVVERNGYLDVTIEGPKVPPRLFFLADDPCRLILVEGARAEYVLSGGWGRLRAGATVCDPVGIGALGFWRGRGPRRLGRPNPTAQATYRVVYRDAEVIFLRGNFPLTGPVRWPGYGDTIAVVPVGPLCRELLDRTTATVEFRLLGPDALVLLTRAGRCPILGLLSPRKGS